MDESIENPLDPTYYYDMYSDAKGDHKGFESDIGKNLRADLTLMNAEYQRDEAWYNAHQSAQAKYDEYAALGMNPLTINRMLLGNPKDAQLQAAPTSNSSGADSQLQQIMDVIQGGLNATNDFVSRNLQMERQEVENDYLRSQTFKNYVEADATPGQAASQNAKNYSGAAKDYSDVERNEKMNEETDAKIRLIGEQYNLTKEQTRQAKQFADSFPEMNAQELKIKKAQTADYCSRVKVNNEQVEKMRHEEGLIDAEKVLAEQERDNRAAERDLIVSENEGQKIKNTIDQQIADYQKLIGFPIGADEKAVMVGYIEKGDYNGLENYLQASFDISMSKNSLSNKVGFARESNGAAHRSRYSTSFVGRTKYNP